MARMSFFTLKSVFLIPIPKFFHKLPSIFFISLFVSLFILPSTAFSLGFGQLKIYSFLNEPLDAEIELLGSESLEPERMLVGLASAQDFKKAGISRPFYLSNVRFEVLRKGRQTFVQLYTIDSIRQPILDMMVELSWPGGRLLREFSILLDPAPPGRVGRKPKRISDTQTQYNIMPSAVPNPLPIEPQKTEIEPNTQNKTNAQPPIAALQKPIAMTAQREGVSTGPLLNNMESLFESEAIDTSSAEPAIGEIRSRNSSQSGQHLGQQLGHQLGQQDQSIYVRDYSQHGVESSSLQSNLTLNSNGTANSNGTIGTMIQDGIRGNVNGNENSDPNQAYYGSAQAQNHGMQNPGMQNQGNRRSETYSLPILQLSLGKFEMIGLMVGLAIIIFMILSVVLVAILTRRNQPYYQDYPVNEYKGMPHPLAGRQAMGSIHPSMTSMQPLAPRTPMAPMPSIAPMSSMAMPSMKPMTQMSQMAPLPQMPKMPPIMQVPQMSQPQMPQVSSMSQPPMQPNPSAHKPLPPMSTPFTFSGAEDEYTLKLALAEQYHEIGDTAEAEGLLNEVLMYGNEEDKEKANQILGSLQVH